MSGLANSSQISLCIPRWVRRDVNSGCRPSSRGAKEIKLRADGAIREQASNSLEVLQGRQLREDGLVIRVLAGTGKVTRVVQHFPALVIDHMALFAGHLAPCVHTLSPSALAASAEAHIDTGGRPSLLAAGLS